MASLRKWTVAALCAAAVAVGGAAAAEPAAESSTPAAAAAADPSTAVDTATGESEAAAAAATEAKAEEPKAASPSEPLGEDPLGLKLAESLPENPDVPPLVHLNGAGVTAPNLAEGTHTTLSLDIDGRIKQTEGLLNRMTWQLNREAAWANSVRDIISNYQYKYTKVLSNIKKHSASTTKMRELLTSMKKARLHEVLEADLSKASRELTELAASSSETSADDNSYAALKDRVALMSTDLAKMSHAKVNKVLHAVQDDLTKAAEESLPQKSDDTLKGLLSL